MGLSSASKSLLKKGYEKTRALVSSTINRAVTKNREIPKEKKIMVDLAKSYQKKRFGDLLD